MGAALGFEFNYADDMRMYNTFRAHQLIDWAEEHGKGHETKLALFGAFFTERRDVSKIHVLVNVASGMGLNPDIARSILESEERAISVCQKEKRWIQRGVTGVPAMIFQKRHLVTGAQWQETYERIIQQQTSTVEV